MTAPSSLVNTEADLSALAVRLAGEPCAALDTEFVWERTFYPILGLVQVGLADGSCFLIDTVALPDLSALAPFLQDRRVVKILHDAPQDLMILKRASGVPARRVFDTRVAAGFAGLDGQISLQNLLASLLGVQLPKGHTRTDWTARPLSPEQVAYAVDDVVHMPQVAATLRERAREAGVEAWLDEELAALFDEAEYEEAVPEDAYLRIKAALYLQPRHLAVLRELAAWRERRAREVNLPRGFVAADHELVSVAQVLPEDERGFPRCRELDPRTAKRHGAALLAAVKRGLDLPGPQWPRPIVDEERQQDRNQIQALTEVIRQKAGERRIDPRLVAVKRDVVRLLADGPGAPPDRHRLLRGWRAELLGDGLKAILGNQ